MAEYSPTAVVDSSPPCRSSASWSAPSWRPASSSTSVRSAGGTADWVWRVPFLASIFLIAVAVFIRLRIRRAPRSSSWRSRTRSASTRSGNCSAPRCPPCSAASDCGWRRTVARTSSRPSPSATSRAGRQTSIGPLAIAFGAARLLHPVLRFAVRPLRPDEGVPGGALIQLVLAFPRGGCCPSATPSRRGDRRLLRDRRQRDARRAVRGPARAVRQPPPLHRRRGRPGIERHPRGWHRPLRRRAAAVLLNNSWVPLAIYVVVLTSIILFTTFVTPETRAAT